MQLKNYKYINNQKPKFKYATGAEGQPSIYKYGVNPGGAYPWDGLPGGSTVNTVDNMSSTTTKIQQGFGNISAPNSNITTPTTGAGVTDLNPTAGGNMNGAKGTSTLQSGNGGAAGGANAKSAGEGFANTGAAWGQAITSSVQAGFAINDAWNQPVKSEGGLLGDAGTSQGQVGGVQYQRQNNINAGAEIAEEKAKANKEIQNVTMATAGAGMATGLAIGATIGGSAGPIGAAAGAVVGTLAGLFVGSAAKKRALHKLNKRIMNAQVKVGTINSYGHSSAQTTQLQQEYAQDNGNTQGQVLYANRGKDMKPKYNSGKSSNKVYSAEGYGVGEHNSWVGKGESIYNPSQQLATYIDKGKVGVDNQKSSVQEHDDNVIFGNDVDIATGTTFAKQAAPYSQKLHFINKQEKKVGKYGQLSSLSQKTKELYNKQIQPQKQQLTEQMNAIAERQRKQHEFENNMKQRKHFAEGKSNFWGNTKDFLGGMYGYASNNIDGIMSYFQNRARQKEAEKEEINPSNTYFRNTAAATALAGMAGLRYDPRPQLNDLRQSMRFNKYNIDQTGGLTAGQKLIARNSLYNDYVNNAAKIYATAEEQNNAYKNQYYNALLKQGAEDRNALTEAARYDDNVYRKAKAAKRQYIDQIIKDQQEILNRLQKRNVDNKRWEDTMSIYQADQNNKKADIDWRRTHANTTGLTGNAYYTNSRNPFGLDMSNYPSLSSKNSQNYGLFLSPYVGRLGDYMSMLSNND